MEKRNLEEILSKENLCEETTLLRKIKDSLPKTREEWECAIKNHSIDFTAGTTFYTPLMALNEYFTANMTSEEIFWSRLYNAGVHFIMMRPFGKVREYLAKKMKVTPESSTLEKLKVNATAMAICQLPTYATVLGLTTDTLAKFGKALGSGFVLCTGTATWPFGWYFDKCRGMFGGKPTLYE